MEYEKKYNEALDRAKQFMNQHPTRAEADLMDKCLFRGGGKQMTCKDLMVGDYVTFRECQHDATPTIVKIWQINGDNEAFVSIDGNDSLDEISIDDEIVGISITPEILKKNGFDFLYSSIPGGTPQEQRIRKVDTYKWRGIVVNYYHETNDFQMIDFRGVRLNYVHQFQHALRLTGIDKEIVL